MNNLLSQNGQVTKIEDKIQCLFTNFQQNLNHIQKLHFQINVALDQNPRQPNEPEHSHPAGHETLRFMIDQIKNITKIAKETQRFHDFFQHGAQNRIEDKPEPQKIEQAQNGGQVLFGNDNETYKEAAHLMSQNKVEENLQKLQQRDKELQETKKIVENKLVHFPPKPQFNRLVMVDEDGEDIEVAPQNKVPGPQEILQHLSLARKDDANIG